MISFAPLRAILKERGITTYYLRNKCGDYNLDSKTICRFMEDRSISTNTVNSLCHILDCDVSDLMCFLPDDKSDTK